MTHRLTLIVSFFSFAQTSFREFGEVGLSTYTGGLKQSLLLAKDLQPVFVKTLYTLSVHTQTHLPKFPETSLNKGKEWYNQS